MNASWLGQALFIGFSLGAVAPAAIALSVVEHQERRSPEFFPAEMGQLNLPNADRGKPRSTIGAGKRLYLPPPVMDEFAIDQDRMMIESAPMPPTEEFRLFDTFETMPEPQGDDGDRLLDAPAGMGEMDSCFTPEAATLFVPVMVNNRVQTFSATPRLWWYVPAGTAIRAEFQLFNAENALVYTQNLDGIGDRPGLLSVQIPENILTLGADYNWMLTLHCDEGDRRGSIMQTGQLQRRDVDAVSFNPQLIDTLIMTLGRQDSYLRLEPTEAAQLVRALLHEPTPETLQTVAKHLSQHWQTQTQTYAELQQSIARLSRDPLADPRQLSELKAQRDQLALELVQLATLFNNWGDAVTVLAEMRQDYPDAWRSLLSSLFPSDDPNTPIDEGELLRFLEQAADLNPTINE